MRLATIATARGPRLHVGARSGYVDVGEAAGDERLSALQYVLEGGQALVARSLTGIDIAGPRSHVQARSPGRGNRGQPHVGVSFLSSQSFAVSPALRWPRPGYQP